MANTLCKSSPTRPLENPWLIGSKIIREPCPAKPGDYFEFFAEIDVLCALSTCPGGGKSSFPNINILIGRTS